MDNLIAHGLHKIANATIHRDLYNCPRKFVPTAGDTRHAKDLALMTEAELRELGLYSDYLAKAVKNRAAFDKKFTELRLTYEDAKDIRETAKLHVKAETTQKQLTRQTRKIKDSKKADELREKISAAFAR